MGETIKKKAWRTQLIHPIIGDYPQSLANAKLQIEICIDRDFGARNGFEAILDREVKLMISVFGRMCASTGIMLKPLPRRVLGAHAFQNAPGLPHGCARHDNIFDLVAPGERTSVKKNELSGIRPQQV